MIFFFKAIQIFFLASFPKILLSETFRVHPHHRAAGLFSIIGNKDLIGGLTSDGTAQISQVNGYGCIDALQHDPLECSVSPEAVIHFSLVLNASPLPCFEVLLCTSCFSLEPK